MRLNEFIERPPALINKTADVDGIQVSVNADGAHVTAYATSNGKRLGYVVFDRDANVLVPYDLAVEERYRGQGIAAVMYDYVKSLGFTIKASDDQTDAGKYFWRKNRGRKRVWESVHAYHGTFQPTLTKFNALSHFGTKQAAEDRLKEKARKEKIKTPGRVYEVVLDIKNPFIAKDFAGVHSPTHFVFDLKSAKLISQEELSAINRHMGTPKQAKLLIKKLRELGFDSIAYKNKYEDKGSTSYVILDPTQVVSVRPLKQKEAVTEARIPDEIEDFLYDLTPEDVGVEEFGPYRVHYEGFTDDCQSSSDYCANPEAVYQQVFADHIAREGGRKPIEQNFTGDEDYPILYSIFKIPRQVKERAERARDAIENIVTMGNIDDYFVRFTDVDKLGYSAQQDFGRMPDIGDADWNPDALPKKKGHPALWFYPASYYLKHKDLFADSRPYVWLVKRRPNAYLQPTQGATSPEAPKGMVRAGLMHKESGVPVAVFFRPEFDVVDRWHEPRQVKEAFDQPYPFKWEKSDVDKSMDALARLPDGSNLSIMFNQDYDDEGEGIYSVEFWRNNSQEVTGEGDQQRVFATVLAAIAQFIKKRKPAQLYFSANKDVEPGQKTHTRSNLYTSLVNRYASALGYEADVSDFAGSTTYKLHKMYENFADGKVKGKSRPGRVKKAGASCKGSVSSLRAKAKKSGGERGKMYHWCANMKSGRSKK